MRFGIGYVALSHNLPDIWLLIHVVFIKVSKTDHRDLLFPNGSENWQHIFQTSTEPLVNTFRPEPVADLLIDYIVHYIPWVTVQ